MQILIPGKKLYYYALVPCIYEEEDTSVLELVFGITLEELGIMLCFFRDSKENDWYATYLLQPLTGRERSIIIYSLNKIGEVLKSCFPNKEITKEEIDLFVTILVLKGTLGSGTSVESILDFGEEIIATGRNEDEGNSDRPSYILPTKSW